jgi:rhodanese-related sulfurtransferase
MMGCLRGARPDGLGARFTRRERSRALRSFPMSAIDEASEIEVDPELLAEWLAEDPTLQVIDVREGYEREAGHIEGTRHIELVALSSAAETVERDRPVVFYCRVGSRSAMAAQAFRASGFTAYSMRGGLLRWAREGRPLSPAQGQVADH